jgi:putative membrane protein
LSDGRDASERMVGYFSYLFTFPSRTTMALAVAALSTIAGVLAFYVGLRGLGGVRALLYGPLGLALPLLLSDLLIVPLLERDAFLNPRRFTIITYASAIVYAAAILVSSIVGALTGRTDAVVRGAMFGVAVNAALRYLGIRVFAATDNSRVLVASFTQPALCFVAASVMLPLDGVRALGPGLLAALIAIGGTQILLTTMRRWEGDHPGPELIPLFRAFVLAWAEDVNGPLEEQITRVGETVDLGVDTIAFEDENEDCNAALIVPYVHPGPFRRVGSSGLPSVLVERVRESGCEALVVHGVSTHSRDLTRSADDERVAEAVVGGLFVSAGSEHATPMVWAERNGARASCQLFGEAALVTLSLSPRSYDDLPEELHYRIVGAAREMGLSACVVDSHHSIDLEGGFDEYDPDDLYEAAVQALRLALGTERSTFAVGVDRVVPGDWGLDEGMGPDGIAALAVRLNGGQTSAYVVIDGNNMAPGLRDEIVEAVKAKVVDEAEVVTSDTHLVNGIGATNSGYFPIGVKTEGGKIVGYSIEAVENALKKLRWSRTRHSHTTIPGLTVLGSAGLEALSHFLESGFELFRRAGSTIMPASLLLAASLLCFL